MLTPVDITNKVFKGGIGYDKKDVETFMLELSTDYRELYSSNVELKDKIATLNESLQHYRSIEDSMQKALTLSEKTAEETVNAANDRARQINTEAEMKAETMLADAKAELQATKDEIYRLQQQRDIFKEQFTKILDAQKKLMDGEMIDIDLGPGFEPSTNAFGSFSGGGLGNDGGLGGGLGAGTYVGAGNDNGRERTNQEPAFDRGTLNMDPFADAANGGGRFSKQTGGAYTGAKKNAPKQNKKPDASKTANLNVKETKPGSDKVKRNVTANNIQPQEKATTINTESASTVTTNPTTSSTSETRATATQTVSKEDVLAAIKAVAEASETVDVSETIQGDVESKVDESRMLDSEDNYSEGFDFIAEETTTQFSYEASTNDDDTYSGEVESNVDESRMLDSEDNHDEGFDFIVDDLEEEEIPTIFNVGNTDSTNANTQEDDVLVGDVEDNIKQSNLIGNDDDAEEGFNFL